MSDTAIEVHQYSMPKKKAVAALAAGKPGDKFTREQMSKIMDVAIPDGIKPHDWRGHSIVTNATKQVERDHNLCWIWVHDDQAWVCQDNSGVVDVCGRRLRVIRKRTRRLMTTVGIVDIRQLKPAELRNHQITTTVAGMLLAAQSRELRNHMAAKISEGVPVPKANVASIIASLK